MKIARRVSENIHSKRQFTIQKNKETTKFPGKKSQTEKEKTIMSIVRKLIDETKVKIEINWKTILQIDGKEQKKAD